MPSPTVSVVIPTYNYGRFIEEAISSVLSQSYQDFEIIVVDDGSTDDTRQRVSRFPKVQYLFQENRGVYSAYNQGAAEARGQYIAFLDADDVWAPQKLGLQLQTAEKMPRRTLVYCGWTLIDEAGCVLPQRQMPRARSLRDLHGGLPFLASSWLLPISGYREINGFDEHMGLDSDWHFALRLALAGYSFCGVPAYLLRRRVHSRQSGMNALNTQEFFKSTMLAVRRMHRELVDSSQGSLGWRAMTYACYLEAAVACASAGREDDAGRYFARAMRLYPDRATRPATYYGVLIGLGPYGFRTARDTHQHLSERHAVALEMLTRAAGEPRNRWASRGLPSLQLAHAALDVGACLVCLRAGAVSEAMNRLLKAARTRPAETNRVLWTMAARRLS